MGDYPTFEQAVEQLRAFLESQGLPREIAWVRPRDVALIGRDLSIRLPCANAARERAGSDYLRGCRQRLGVLLGVLCRVDAQVCCFVYIPQDEDESSRHLMPDGLKLTIPISVPEARAVVDRLEWHLARWQSRRWRSQKIQLFQRE